MYQATKDIDTNNKYFEDRIVSHNEIIQWALEKMREYNMYPIARDTNLIVDGHIHRYTIEGQKPKSKNGAYVLFSDGIPGGYIQDWSNPDARYNINMNYSGGYSERVKTDIEQWKKHEEQRQKEREEKQTAAADQARRLYQEAGPPPYSHAYLRKKDIVPCGARYSKFSDALLIPMYTIDGHLVNVQTILPNGTKLYRPGAIKSRAFFPIDLEHFSPEGSRPILVGEGYATMCKIHEITGFCCIAAMDCGNIVYVCEDLHKKYPSAKIIVTADNDLETQKKLGRNPGLTCAQNAVNLKYAVGVIAPKFDTNEPEGTDWDDYALVFGNEAAKNALMEGREGIKQLCMTPKQREKYFNTLTLCSLLGNLDPEIKIPPQEYIGGLFPVGYVSALVAPSGTGKTIFMQKAVSDLSVGGSFFDGFSEDETPKRSLIFAAEAGYSLLLRRGAMFRWPINPKNVQVADQYTFECNGKSLMLDTDEGFENIKSLIDAVNPHIVFFDTFGFFHDKDENKAVDMKPILKELANIARYKNLAMVLNHHSRKRTSKERALSLNQDDVIGSSIFNRLVSLIIGIEPHAEDEKTLRVRPLKSWFKAFMPFDYKITEDFYGHSVVQFTLNPDDNNNSRILIWNYLQENYTAGQWFSASQIPLAEIGNNINERTFRRTLNDFVNSGNLDKKGSTKDVKYAIMRL